MRSNAAQIIAHVIGKLPIFPSPWAVWLVCCRFTVSNVSLLTQGPVLLTFEEDDAEASELMVSQVSSFQKSARNKVRKPPKSVIDTGVGLFPLLKMPRCRVFETVLCSDQQMFHI